MTEENQDRNNTVEIAFIRFRDTLITIASRPCARAAQPGLAFDCKEARVDYLAWCSECLARSVLE